MTKQEIWSMQREDTACGKVFLLGCRAQSSLKGKWAPGLEVSWCNQDIEGEKVSHVACLGGPVTLRPMVKQKHYGKRAGQRKFVYLVWTGRRERQTGRSWGQDIPFKDASTLPCDSTLPTKPHLLIGWWINPDGPITSQLHFQPGTRVLIGGTLHVQTVAPIWF